MEIRLQKFFTDCGVMSRRAAEAEIAAGHVKVNGEIAIVGQKIDIERDVVTYNGKRVRMPKKPNQIYIMLNKPRGYVTTSADEKGRKCVTELVSDVGTRVYPVGRLDMNSDGLLLLTNDGELANFLTHPRHEIPKIYHVRVKGTPSDEEIRKLGEPIEIEGVMTLPAEVRLLSSTEETSLLEFVLFEGRNRQIRRMCEAHGLEIRRLTRVAIGEITLGRVSPGKWKHLSETQVGYLKKAMKKNGVRS